MFQDSISGVEESFKLRSMGKLVFGLLIGDAEGGSLKLILNEIWFNFVVGACEDADFLFKTLNSLREIEARGVHIKI